MVIILYLWYIQNGAPKLLLMAQPLRHPQSESGTAFDFCGRDMTKTYTQLAKGFYHSQSEHLGEQHAVQCCVPMCNRLTEMLAHLDISLLKDVFVLLFF